MMEQYPQNQAADLEDPLMNRSRIATEDASYHSIRIYNMVRDRLWERLELIQNGLSLEELSRYIQELRLLLLRGDKVWLEISKTVAERKKDLKIDTSAFPYTEQLKKLADEIERYYVLINRADMMSMMGDQSALEFLQMPPELQSSYIKQGVEAIVLRADEIWGEHAAIIGFTMPIEIKDSRDPFL